MARRSGRQIIVLGFLAAVTPGCAPYAAFEVETAIQPDGSCVRTFVQPKGEFLPDESSKPEWNARWRSVTDTDMPASAVPPDLSSAPASSAFGFSIQVEPNKRSYFKARGTFSSPQQIPAHYRYADAKCPEAGVSELVRSFERTNYGFLVEYAWREKITNMVTLPSYLKGRDELLDLVIPTFIEGLEKEFGQDFDLTGLSDFIRKDGRRFLDDAALTFYDLRARLKLDRDGSTLERDFSAQIAQAAKRAGLDLFDERGTPLDSNSEEAQRRTRAFGRRVLTQCVKHKDGRALSPAELDALIQGKPADTHSQKANDDVWNAIQRRMKQDKVFEKRIRTAFLRVTGVYGPLDFPFMTAGPVYEFVLSLPGELVETNGTRMSQGKTRWKLCSFMVFPDGYEMNARSVAIDRETQRKTLGRVVIDDTEGALEFMNLVGGEGALLEAVRAFSKTGEKKLLSDVKTHNQDEAERADKLRKVLFGS